MAQALKLICEPASKYHARAADYLTSHQLADFRKCPLLYYRKKHGIIKDIDRPAYLVGRALHALVLEGREAFEAQYAVGGPINPKTGEVYGSGTKAFAEWAAEQGKPVLTDDQYATIKCMAGSVLAHKLARQLLANGLPERVVRAKYHDTHCQIRMDWFGDECGLVDLKSCDDLDWFVADAKRFQYIHQLAFYRSILQSAGGRAKNVSIIAVEKKEPYRCGVWSVADSALDQAAIQNGSAIEWLRLCESLNVWPTGYEDCRTISEL